MRELIVVGERPEGVPETCPITGLPFFSMEYDEDGNLVPTYGGPFDTYTIPTQNEDGDWVREHYDHDKGGWIDGVEVLSEYDLLPHLRQQMGGGQGA